LTINKPAEMIVQQWLDANGKHLAENLRCPHTCYYLNDNGYNYTDKFSGPVSVQEAFAEGWFWVSNRGIECCCQNQIPILAME
jgi:hypothetical protein